jgi:hypothetical protein
MLGNTGFLTGMEWNVSTATTEVRVGIRNNATIPGGNQDFFWAGQTRVYLEFVPMLPSNDTFEALTNSDGLQFTHQVWPGIVTEEQVTSGAQSS